MSITCPFCGKTNISPGTSECPVCHKMLPVVLSSSYSSGAVMGLSKPILVDGRGRHYSLNLTAVAVIGSRGCAILISDPGVPPQAAQLTPHGGGFLLEDICGSVKVNGSSIPTALSLKPGDKITVGATTLTYQGPSAPPLPIAPSPIASASSPTMAVVVPPPPPPIPLPSSPPGITLKSWGANPPVVEGYVELVDGPHRVEKGSMGAKVATSLALSFISSTLAMMPFWMQREVNVWFLRIKDHASGKMLSVVMRGEPGSLPQLGDFIAVWGMIKVGNVIMQRGYSYTTDSEIRLKG